MRAFIIFAFVAAVTSAACSQETQTSKLAAKNMPEVKVLSAIDVEETDGDELMRATTVEVTFAPGASGMPHRHPGAVYGYVIEGQFRFKVEGKPERTLKAGETFYEPKMILHEISANPSDTIKTRILAVIVHSREAKQLAIPEPPVKLEDKK